MKRPRSHRPDRLAALVRETLAELIVKELKDPRISFVTLTDVRVSADCSSASIRFSCLGTEEEKKKALDGLNSARGFLRSSMAGTLQLRITPELRFYVDRGLEHAARIDKILGNLEIPEA